MSSLVPFGHFSGLDLGRAFGMSDMFRNMFEGTMGGAFKVDVRDEGDKYVIDADLPGLHREMINVEAKDGVLTITANMDSETQTQKDDYVVRERRQGTMTRSFSFTDVNEDGISASYKEGVLTVILPKGKDNEDSARRIQID